MSGEGVDKMGEMGVRGERGMISAVFLVFLVTLGLMGLGIFKLIQGEARSVTEHVTAGHVKYAANGAAYYGMRCLDLGALDETTALGIGAVNVVLDSSIVGDELHLHVEATQGDLKSKIRIRMKPRTLADYAVYLAGAAVNVNTRDSTGLDETSVLVDNASSMPGVDTATLYAMSTAQGHDQTDATFVPPDGYGGSYYQADGVTPNVHHIMGSLDVIGGRSIYGLFVVDGSIEIAGSARVVGVIYVVNPLATLILGGGSPSGASITGGIVSHGDLFGTGSHISITHQPEYMRTFTQWADPIAGFNVLAWEYL